MAKPPKPVPAPDHLSGLGREFWESTQATYGITDPSGLRLLKLACEALETAERARIALAEHGQVYTDRFGAPRPRPEVTIARDAMTTFRGMIRELRLDPPTGETK